MQQRPALVTTFQGSGLVIGQSLFSYAKKVSIGHNFSRIRIGDWSNLYLVMQQRSALATTLQESGLRIGQIFMGHNFTRIRISSSKMYISVKMRYSL
jgi:hypothetical protein